MNSICYKKNVKHVCIYSDTRHTRYKFFKLVTFNLIFIIFFCPHFPDRPYVLENNKKKTKETETETEAGKVPTLTLTFIVIVLKPL